MADDLIRREDAMAAFPSGTAYGRGVKSKLRAIPSHGSPASLVEAAKGLRKIVEEITGAMNHGTWRDEHGMRLKDTPEWVALYNALAGTKDHG